MRITVKPLNDYAKKILVTDRSWTRGYGRIGITIVHLPNALRIIFPDKMMGLPIGKFMTREHYETEVHKMCAKIGLASTDYELEVV